MSDKALEGYKVLDLSWHISGPYCTKVLAELGAEVIKVEKADGGDPARMMPPFFEDDAHPEKSLLFLYLNTGKKSITMNLKTDQGKELLKKLVQDSDVLVENFSPRVMPGLGLDYETLVKTNPEFIMTSISNFGQNGPYRNYKASDITAMAMGGLMHMTGDPEREPLTYGGWQAQYQGGISAFAATMCALFYRDMGQGKEKGQGQHIDISIMESIAQILELFDLSYQVTGELYSRSGMRWANRPAWGIYPCADGYIGLVSGPVRRWLQISKLMDERLLADPKYIARRRELADEIDALMLGWLLEHTKEEIYHAAQSQDPKVPASPVRTPEDLINSPQFEARGFFTEVKHPVAGKGVYPGPAAKLSETPMQVTRSPLLGEHNEEVYGRMGYTRSDLKQLKNENII
ncbi:MAG: CoA transferase [Deltaproteobacteria bacterium]|nr:CoA transferase [Deltaproteobacteria bacterium]